VKERKKIRKDGISLLKPYMHYGFINLSVTADTYLSVPFRTSYTSVLYLIYLCAFLYIYYISFRYLLYLYLYPISTYTYEYINVSFSKGKVFSPDKYR